MEAVSESSLPHVFIEGFESAVHKRATLVFFIHLVIDRVCKNFLINIGINPVTELPQFHNLYQVKIFSQNKTERGYRLMDTGTAVDSKLDFAGAALPNLKKGRPRATSKFLGPAFIVASAL
jgi:hypothetical protein